MCSKEGCHHFLFFSLSLVICVYLHSMFGMIFSTTTLKNRFKYDSFEIIDVAQKQREQSIFTFFIEPNNGKFFPRGVQNSSYLYPVIVYKSKLYPNRKRGKIRCAAMLPLNLNAHVSL